ncbi:2-aminoethylphosphonate aminotransferase [Mycobacterium sp. NPDC048908]|uniref:2-aminoethylphosphonate aminotransferase n=1 Tax=Mycobacterium sp. NPDC048908 TaxID=3364292 RepID=UPI00371508A3
MILLNPGPANTTETVKRAMTRPDICPREREFGEVLRRVRDGLTRVVHDGEPYTTVMLGGSGTAGVEAAISSAVPADGRLLVIDNGAYGHRMSQIARAYGIAYDVKSFSVGGFPDLQEIRAQLEQQTYTQLAVVHHETSTGLLNPVEEIGALCREHGVEMIVDAMSSYAGLMIDIERMQADFLIASSNKCIQGMAGVCFVICRRERLAAMQPVPGRSFYLNLAGNHQFFEQHQQMQFTPPVQVIYALEQALREYLDEGGPNRQKRYFASWETLDSGMQRLGFRGLLPEAMLSKILTSYIEPDHPNYSFDEMHDRLYAKGFTIYPGKGAARATFRLANMGAVDADDMRAFLAAMAETINEMGLEPLYSEKSSAAGRSTGVKTRLDVRT